MHVVMHFFHARLMREFNKVWVWVRSSSRTVLRKKHVNSLLRMLSKSATFLDFQLSQGSDATYCRFGGNLCGAYI